MRYLDVIQVALTSWCNLKCPMCGQPNVSDTEMPASVWDRLLESLERAGRPPILAIAVRGEPLSHPRFAEYLDALRVRLGARRFIRELYLDTNAHYLAGEPARAILDLCAEHPWLFFRLTCSLDAANGHTYRVVRRFGDFERVQGNVAAFLRRRVARRCAYPAINAQFIVMPQNVREAPHFLAAWSNRFAALGLAHEVTTKYPEHRLENVSFVYHHPLHPTPSRLAESRRLHALAAAIARRPLPDTTVAADRPADEPCVWPFYMMVVDWDGTVSPCCLDTNRELALGRLSEARLDRILETPHAVRFRAAHVAGELDAYPKCASCPDRLVVERPDPVKIADFRDRFLTAPEARASA